jgi:hypothetical protein
MGLSGLTYLVQGWVAGADGFPQTHDLAIVLAWVLNLVWMIWLVVVAWRAQDLRLFALNLGAGEGAGVTRRARVIG